MLGKLIKHDFKATAKVLLPLDLLLVVMTILGSLLLSTDLLRRAELLPVSILLLIVYVMSIITLDFVTMIYLAVYFYKNLYSAQGYLTFTLPATPWTLLNSKVIAGFLWSLFNNILSLASAFALIVAAGGSTIFKDRGFTFNTTYNFNGEKMTIPTTLEELVGYSIGQLFFLVILFIFTSCLFSVMIGYASIILGQLSSRHKVGAAVGIYAGFYFVLQIIASAIMIFLSVRPIFDLVKTADENFSPADFQAFSQALYQPMLPILIVTLAVAGVICYVVSGIIMNRNVNLE